MSRCLFLTHRGYLFLMGISVSYGFFKTIGETKMTDLEKVKVGDMNIKLKKTEKKRSVNKKYLDLLNDKHKVKFLNHYINKTAYLLMYSDLMDGMFGLVYDDTVSEQRALIDIDAYRTNTNTFTTFSLNSGSLI
jgi:hypothetical protein